MTKQYPYPGTLAHFERLDAKERKVARVTFNGRKNAHGEYVVRAYDQHGKRFAEADYFTNDKADAEATAAKMVRT